MITEQDLQEAIAECLGQRNPNASTCIKLAAFYTIRHELFGGPTPPDANYMPTYSMASTPDLSESAVQYDGDSEFAQIVNGADPEYAWSVMDELMETIKLINPRLYVSVLGKLKEG